MEKPPQEPAKKIQISAQEFAQESKRAESYLSLLPTDITRMVRQYAYAELADVITAIRHDYLTDELNKDLFLHDPEFNRKIIDELMQRFKLYAMGKFKVGLMLNTPSSFKIASEIFSPNLHQYLSHVIVAFTQYIQNTSLNYQEAINYTREFLYNIRELLKKSHPRDLVTEYDPYPYIVEQNKKDYKENWIPYFINSIVTVIASKFIYELEKEKVRVPEIKVALDIGDEDMQEWIEWIIQLVYDPYQKDIPSAIMRFKNRNFGMQAALLGRIVDPLGSPNNLLYDQFKIAVCNDLTDLLMKALHDNEHEKIVLLFKLVTIRNDKALSGCIEERIQGNLGAQIVEYLIKNNFPETIVSKLYVGSPFAYLLTLHLINRAQATPGSVLQFIKAVNLILKFKKYDYSRDDINLLRVQQDVGSAMLLGQMRQSEVARKYGIQILLAVVQSPRMNEAVLKDIIEGGTDINGADEEGITILMHAIKNARVDVVRILVEQKNIKIHACDKKGHNALWYARNLETDMATRLAIIELLQQAGATEEEACAVQ